MPEQPRTIMLLSIQSIKLVATLIAAVLFLSRGNNAVSAKIHKRIAAPVEVLSSHDSAAIEASISTLRRASNGVTFPETDVDVNPDAYGRGNNGHAALEPLIAGNEEALAPAKIDLSNANVEMKDHKKDDNKRIKNIGYYVQVRSPLLTPIQAAVFLEQILMSTHHFYLSFQAGG